MGPPVSSRPRDTPKKGITGSAMSLSYSSTLFFLFIVLFSFLITRFHFRLNGDFQGGYRRHIDDIHSASLLPLLFFPLVGSSVRLCRTRFRLNGAFRAGSRWNAFGLSAPSPLSLNRSFLLILSLCRFHFPLNGGLLSPFVSSRRFHPSPPTVTRTLPTEWWLRSRPSME
jgi:hypothetical protein